MIATATYSPLNAPTVNTQEIIDALRVIIPQGWNVPIYDEFPSLTDNVRYGLYVSEVYTASKSVNQLGVQYCGAYYNAIDTFNIAYISFQQDPYEQQISAIIGDLPTLQIDNVQLFNGYFSRTYSQDLNYGPTRAAIHTWTFELTRLEFNT